MFNFVQKSTDQATRKKTEETYERIIKKSTFKGIKDQTQGIAKKNNIIISFNT